MVYRRGAFLVFPVGPVMPRRVLSGVHVAGIVGDFMRRMNRSWRDKSQERPPLSRSRHNALPGTSEQTQDIEVFAPRSVGSCCGTMSVIV
jgi:hypothetical protein